MMTATFLQRDSRGRAADLMPIIDELKANGRSLAQIAKELNARGIETPRGGEWQATQVARVIARHQIEGIDEKPQRPLEGGNGSSRSHSSSIE